MVPVSPLRIITVLEVPANGIGQGEEGGLGGEK